MDYKKLTAIANNAEWGTVEGAGYYDNGAEVTLTATVNNGYRFVKWSDDVVDNPRTVVVTQDSTFTAIFEANTFAITTAVNDDAMGSVTKGGEYAYGSEITLTATPNDGYRFAQWSDGNTDNPRTITVTENKTYTAEFEVEVFGVFAASEVPSMGGVKVTLTAEPIKGFEFVEWTDGNTDNPRILTLTENIEVYARFQIVQGENPTDLENSKISSANIYTTNGTLHVEGATDDYHILDAAGRLIYSGNATTLTLQRGIYLITMDGEVEKIVL
ncbi:MAG: InlB B-repeat-containing protein [Paludibacteraceae bacterium]|nr:InlB B-repeat-containing protein [Paludibacteraceae bacterium]